MFSEPLVFNIKETFQYNAQGAYEYLHLYHIIIIQHDYLMSLQV